MKTMLFWLAALTLFLSLSAPAGAQGYESAIYAACARYGCDGAYLVNVAQCESQMNPYAVGSQGEYGIFQVKLWIWPEAGTDPYSQIEWTAMMFASGYSYLWSCA